MDNEEDNHWERLPEELQQRIQVEADAPWTSSGR